MLRVQLMRIWGAIRVFWWKKFYEAEIERLEGVWQTFLCPIEQ